MSRVPECVEAALRASESMCRNFIRDPEIYRVSRSDNRRSQSHTDGFQAHWRRSRILLQLERHRDAMDACAEALKLSATLGSTQRDKVVVGLEHLKQDIITDYKACRKAEAAKLKLSADEVRARELAQKKKYINFIRILPVDVLTLVCQMGLEDDPHFTFKMGRVCKQWYEMVISQPALWNALVLDTRKPVKKAQVWAERSKGRLRHLKIEQMFNHTLEADTVSALKDSMGRLKSLDLRAHLRIFPQWKTKFDQLEELVVHNISSPSRLDYDLCAEESSSLRKVEITRGHLVTYSLPLPASSQRPSSSQQSQESSRAKVVSATTTENFRQLSSIQSLSVERCFLQVVDYSRLDFLRQLPSLEEVSIRVCEWIPPTHGPDVTMAHRQRLPARIQLDRLRSYAEDANLRDIVFSDRLHAPNLEELRFWSSTGPSVLNQILAPGLALARPNLRVLDIGKCAVDQAALLVALRYFPSLEFLNVAFCSLEDGFIKALHHNDGLDPEDQLLPRLVALSVAGNETLSPGIMRDFVNSRLPSSERLQIRSSQAPQPKASSAFKPTAPAKAKVTATQIPSSASGSSRRNASQQVSTSTSSTFDIPADFFDTQVDPVKGPRPRIRWLNLDHCGLFQSGIVDLLSHKVRFVSAFHGTLVEDRIRGLGRFRWDAEFFDGCETKGDTKCGLRENPSESRVIERISCNVLMVLAQTANRGRCAMCVVEITETREIIPKIQMRRRKHRGGHGTRRLEHSRLAL